jgi:hypothetical protein
MGAALPREWDDTGEVPGGERKHIEVGRKGEASKGGH